MNKDFRVSITCADHPKVEKLERRCGPKAFRCLMRLWGFVAATKPDGSLAGMDADDIEIAARWEGAPGEFVGALVALRLLEEDAKGLSVHDWTDHNEYASYAQDRKEQASKAAKARWKSTGGNADSCVERCSQHAPSNADSCNEECPLPSPIPIPNPSQKDKESSSNSCANRSTKSAKSEQHNAGQDDFDAFWAAYPKRKSKGQALRAWAASAKHRPALPVILAAIAAQCAGHDWLKDGGKFIPYPATWINAQGWLDEVRQAPPQGLLTKQGERNFAAAREWAQEVAQ
jgi:hypothetical protein